MSKIYTIVPVNFEYNDEYDYTAGFRKPVEAFKSKENAEAEISRRTAVAMEKNPVSLESGKTPKYFEIVEVEVSDEDLQVKSYEDFRILKELAEQEMKKRAGDYFSTLCEEVFEKHPKLFAFKLRNYTPYFNDGESCEFGVGEPYIKYGSPIGEGDLKAGDYDDGFVSIWDNKDNSELANAYKDVQSLVSSISKDDFLNMFGDHVCVLATRDGKVTTSEFQHD